MKVNRNTVGSSPTNNDRGCLCIDTDTYSKKCCEGYLMNQGIGKTQSSYYYEATMTVGGAYSNSGYIRPYPNIGSITNDKWYNKDYKVVSISYNIDNNVFYITFEKEYLPNFNELIIDGKIFSIEDGLVTSYTSSGKTYTVVYWNTQYPPYPNVTGTIVDVKGR